MLLFECFNPLRLDSNQGNATRRCSSTLMSYLRCMLDCLLADDLFNWFISWLLTPIVLAFLIPMVVMMLIYVSSLILYSYQLGLFRRLVRAASERDIERAAKELISTMWLVTGKIWFGYEVHGEENIPAKGPALLIYYHGALPVDYYYLVSHITLHRQREIMSVVDLFLFKIFGMGSLLNAFNCTPGTVDGCVEHLEHGDLLGLSPGGVYEAQFSDNRYQVLWKNRLGFAKIVLQAKVPIIPVFTRNVREAFRTVSGFRGLGMKLYDKIKFPCVPLYGGFPVKLKTFVGKPIHFEESDTPEFVRDRCKQAIEELILCHQRIPGNILWALLERFRFFQPREHDS